MNESVKDTSLQSYQENQKLGRDQQIVYEVILNEGPTHDNRILQALRQVEKQKPQGSRRNWEMSAVNGRRNQLVGKGVVCDIGSWMGMWKDKPKKYHFWAVTNCNRTPAGWHKNIETMPGWMQKFFKKTQNTNRQPVAAFKETLF